MNKSKIDQTEMYIKKLDKQYPAAGILKKKTLDKRIRTINKRYTRLPVKILSLLVLATFGLFMLRGRIKPGKPLRLSDISFIVPDNKKPPSPPPPPPPPSSPQSPPKRRVISLPIRIPTRRRVYQSPSPPKTPSPTISISSSAPSNVSSLTYLFFNLFKAIGGGSKYPEVLKPGFVRVYIHQIKSYEKKPININIIYNNIVRLFDGFMAIYHDISDTKALRIASLLLKYIIHLNSIRTNKITYSNYIQRYNTLKQKTSSERHKQFIEKVIDDFKTQHLRVIQRQYREHLLRKQEKIKKTLYTQTAEEIQKKKGKHIQWKETVQVRTIPRKSKQTYKLFIPHHNNTIWNEERFNSQNQPENILKGEYVSKSRRRRPISKNNIERVIEKRRKTSTSYNNNDTLGNKKDVYTVYGVTRGRELDGIPIGGLIFNDDSKTPRFETEKEANAWGNQYRKSLKKNITA